MIPDKAQRHRLWRRSGRFGVLYKGFEYLIPLDHAKDFILSLAESGYAVSGFSLWGEASQAPGDFFEFPGSYDVPITASAPAPTAAEAARMMIDYLSEKAETIANFIRGAGRDMAYLQISLRDGNLEDWFREWLSPSDS